MNIFYPSRVVGKGIVTTKKLVKRGFHHAILRPSDQIRNGFDISLEKESPTCDSLD